MTRSATATAITHERVKAPVMRTPPAVARKGSSCGLDFPGQQMNKRRHSTEPAETAALGTDSVATAVKENKRRLTSAEAKAGHDREITGDLLLATSESVLRRLVRAVATETSMGAPIRGRCRIVVWRGTHA